MEDKAYYELFTALNNNDLNEIFISLKKYIKLNLNVNRMIDGYDNTIFKSFIERIARPSEKIDNYSQILLDEIILLFLKNGAKNTGSVFNTTPLKILIKNEMIDEINLLLKYVDFTPREVYTALLVRKESKHEITILEIFKNHDIWFEKNKVGTYFFDILQDETKKYFSEISLKIKKHKQVKKFKI